jgi:hypothetical protein
VNFIFRSTNDHHGGFIQLVHTRKGLKQWCKASKVQVLTIGKYLKNSFWVSILTFLVYSNLLSGQF